MSACDYSLFGSVADIIPRDIGINPKPPKDTKISTDHIRLYQQLGTDIFATLILLHTSATVTLFAARRGLM